MERRLNEFVGRASQRALVADLMSERGPAVVFVHGPGGIGKSALLDAVASDAVHRGLQVRALDITGVSYDRARLADVLATLEPGRRALLVVDDCDHAQVAIRWMRYHWTTDIPADAIIVIASRPAPPRGLQSGVGWPARIEVIPLGELSAENAVELAERAGVPAELRDRVVKQGAGNPLALTVLAGLAVTNPDALPVHALEENMSVVGQLLDGIVGTVPSGRHRRALQVAAHLRHTTEELLSAAVPGDVHDLFEWLRHQPYVEQARRGLEPSTIVRAIVEADLRWRDMAAFRAMDLAVMRALIDRVESPEPELPNTVRCVVDTLYLRPDRAPALLGLTEPEDWTFFDSVIVHDYAAETRPELEDAAPERSWPWIDRSIHTPGNRSTVFRDGTRTIVAFGRRATYSQVSLAQSDDPAAGSMLAHTRQHGQARDGETISITRVDAFTPELDGHAAVFALGFIAYGAQVDAGAAWEAIVVPDHESWREALAYHDLHHVEDLDDGLALYAHDWRRLDLRGVFRLLTEQPWDPVPHEPTGVSSRVFVAEDEFAVAVRQAMKGLSSDSKLAANPLVDSRLVRGGDPEVVPEHRLRSLIREEALALREEHPELYEIVDYAYLRRSTSQENVAAMLGVPFTTFRRHRNRAVGLIAAALWAKELGSERG